MPPKVDLILVFRSSPGKVLSRRDARENARQAERQYTKLLEVLKAGGLRAVGKRGENDGQLLVLVSCPQSTLARLVKRERHSDFIYGLPTADPTAALDLNSLSLSPADCLRLVHTYVTSTITDGGLGVAPGSTNWDRIESVMMLHDNKFNEEWIRSWTRKELGFVTLTEIRRQFGEGIALYFAFLSYYTKYLIFISVAGAYFYFFHEAYSTIYSSVLLLWSITFVESWRIRQRILSVRWRTRGSFRVEKRRAQYVPISWWKKDFRMLAGLPVIMLFAAVLAVLLMIVFVFEAFIATLYTGPGSRFVSFAPTIIVSVVVPRFLSIYHSYAVAFTNWENHGHQSSHDASLTLKSFALAGFVDYLGLALSAFVYVPFGEETMALVQHMIEKEPAASMKITSSLYSALPSRATAKFASASANAARAANSTKGKARSFWEMDVMSARKKLSPTRLQDQMFAITVTNQAVNAFLEIGLPYVLRAVAVIRRRGLRSGASSNGSANSGKKKRVSFEDEAGKDDAAQGREKGSEEREFLEEVWRQVALPPYELFTDYNEMVTQFGYVALWSTIWPLAPLMALTNNWFELRSDAFKIAKHVRRPIPARTDTIGPWLDTLQFLAWLAFLTNSALVYLFRPLDHCKAIGTSLDHNHSHLASRNASPREILGAALLVALGASHGYFVVCITVRHVLERLMWRGTTEEREAESVETAVKEEYLKSLGVADVASAGVGEIAEADAKEGEADPFWSYDEGLDELSRETKES